MSLTRRTFLGTIAAAFTATLLPVRITWKSKLFTAPPTVPEVITFNGIPWVTNDLIAKDCVYFTPNQDSIEAWLDVGTIHVDYPGRCGVITNIEDPFES